MTREELLALADELEGMDCREGCRTCPADGTEDCRGDLSCEEAVARAVVRRVREIVEHDECEVTTMGAYDLLPDDERKAIAWVREHGGLDAVKAFVRQAEMEHGYLLKIAHALGTSIYDGSDNADALLEKLSERLMPEGLSWPVFEDGTPVWFGDETRRLGEVLKVSSISLYLDGSYALNLRAYSKDERVKRSAPKALDADGVEIRVGDVLYRKSDGRMVKVAEVYEKTFTDADGYVRPGDGFTHRAPVLAADGRPLREGEHVYHVETGAELVVKKLPKPGEYQAVIVFALPTSPASHLTSFDPNLLTHQRPVLDAGGVPIREGDTVYNKVTGEPGTAIVVDNDGQQFATVKSHDRGNWCDPLCFTHTKPEPPDSWERLEHDAEKTVCEYFGANYDCADCPLEPDRCDEEAKKDIIRRAKALAERGGL